MIEKIIVALLIIGVCLEFYALHLFMEFWCFGVFE